MRHCVGTAFRIVGLFLVAQFCIVHCLGSAAPARAQSAATPQEGAKREPAEKKAAPLKIAYGSDQLPPAVQDMREAILSAVASGNIEELRHAYELNELKPDLGGGPIADPIAYWRQISGDGAGLEILAILAGILDSGFVALAQGRDVENAKVYVWPYFAEVPVAALSPAQEVELLRLVPPAMVREMKATGRYTYWRIAIGADGTWHSFRRQP